MGILDVPLHSKERDNKNPKTYFIKKKKKKEKKNTYSKLNLRETKLVLLGWLFAKSSLNKLFNSYICLA